MTSKIFKSIILTVLTSIILTVSMFMVVLYNQYTKEMSDTLKGQVIYIENGIILNGVEYLNSIKSNNNRITLITTDGDVIYDNEKDTTRLDNHLEREEIKEALALGEGSSKRYSDTMGKEAIYYAKKIDGDMILRVSVLVSTVDALLLGMSSNIFWIIIITVIIALLLAKRSVKEIIKPINEMNIDGKDYVAPYQELNPLFLKLERQNNTIEEKMVELRRKQLEFNSITSRMNEGLIIINSHLEVLSANASALRMFGLKTIEEGDSVYTFNHSSEFIEAVKTSIKGMSNELNVEYGSSVYKVIISPVTEDNVTNGAVIIVMDYTEKEKEEALRKEFSANVSHELKTPLTSISGFAEIMKNNLVDPEDVSDIAGNIYDEAQRLIALVEDIIHLSRLDSGNIKSSFEDNDLYVICENVIARLKDAADKRDITLNLNGGHIIYHGVEAILDEMIYNLVDNSIKYGKTHGTTDISLKKEDGHIIISVKDDGIGIEPGEQSRVFERFYRIDKSHSKKISGTGLGLSIVKHGAEYHGGYVTLESIPQKGTTFEIHL